MEKIKKESKEADQQRADQQRKEKFENEQAIRKIQEEKLEKEFKEKFKKQAKEGALKKAKPEEEQNKIKEQLKQITEQTDKTAKEMQEENIENENINNQNLNAVDLSYLKKQIEKNKKTFQEEMKKEEEEKEKKKKEENIKRQKEITIQNIEYKKKQKDPKNQEKPIKLQEEKENINANSDKKNESEKPNDSINKENTSLNTKQTTWNAPIKKVIQNVIKKPDLNEQQKAEELKKQQPIEAIIEDFVKKYPNKDPKTNLKTSYIYAKLNYIIEQSKIQYDKDKRLLKSKQLLILKNKIEAEIKNWETGLDIYQNVKEYEIISSTIFAGPIICIISNDNINKDENKIYALNEWLSKIKLFKKIYESKSTWKEAFKKAKVKIKQEKQTKHIEEERKKNFSENYKELKEIITEFINQYPNANVENTGKDDYNSKCYIYIKLNNIIRKNHLDKHPSLIKNSLQVDLEDINDLIIAAKIKIKEEINDWKNNKGIYNNIEKYQKSVGTLMKNSDDKNKAYINEDYIDKYDKNKNSNYYDNAILSMSILYNGKNYQNDINAYDEKILTKEPHDAFAINLFGIIDRNSDLPVENILKEIDKVE